MVDLPVPGVPVTSMTGPEESEAEADGFVASFAFLLELDFDDFLLELLDFVFLL